MPHVTATGPLPPDVVWERYTDPARWSQWAPQVRAVTGTVEPVLPGDRGWVLGPAWTRAPFEVLAVDPAGHRWSWRVGPGPLAVEMEHGVEPEGHGSRAWVDIRAPRLLVLPYLPVARWALGRLVRP